MKICSVCKGNCDSGELVGGICPECLAEERREQVRAKELSRMLRSPFFQMAIDMEVGRWQ